jgi:glycosyltransferase involved in cell wall biosynthesis
MGPASDREAHGRGLGQHGEQLSIVVPTYNCARWLGDTLRSLQAQGPRLNDAEIVVMDDHSTTDDPEAVVREVWGDRVAFVRHPQNLGPTRNFNACLDRARRVMPASRSTSLRRSNHRCVSR